jgi:hypothetical protein
VRWMTAVRPREGGIKAEGGGHTSFVHGAFVSLALRFLSFDLSLSLLLASIQTFSWSDPETDMPVLNEISTFAPAPTGNGLTENSKFSRICLLTSHVQTDILHPRSGWRLR